MKWNWQLECDNLFFDNLFFDNLNDYSLKSTTCTVIGERSSYETYFLLSLVFLINVHWDIWDVSTHCNVGNGWLNISIYLKVNWDLNKMFFVEKIRCEYCFLWLKNRKDSSRAQKVPIRELTVFCKILSTRLIK